MGIRRIEQALTGLESDYAVDPGRTNTFTYNQQLVAGYRSLKLDTKRKWNPKNVQTGNPFLNHELTHATELS